MPNRPLNEQDSEVRDNMSARDDYQLAKAFVRERLNHELLPTARYETITDDLRSLLTQVRLSERKQWARLAKEWAAELETLDEEYLAAWLRHFSDNIKNGVAELPDMGPPESLEEIDLPPLIAKPEEEL